MLALITTVLASGAGPEPVELMAPQPSLIVWTLLSFAILLVALYFTAWPRIIAAIDEREKRIAGRYDKAAATLAEAEQLLAAHEARLAKADEEAQAIIDEARRDAEHVTLSIRASAKDELERLIARGKQEINLAKEKAADELQQQVVALVLGITEKVLEEQIVAHDQELFIERCVDVYRGLRQ